MDATVTNAVVTVEKLGNLSPIIVSFFDKEVPTVAKTEGERLAILRFKTDKETKTKRANMAVRVFMFNPDDFGDKPSHDFVQALIHDYHDGLLVRCANGEISQDQAVSREWMVKDYFDTSRDSNGRKVTKESIGSWFDLTIATTVSARALAKNAQMTESTLAGVRKGYREMFQKFTGYNVGNAFTDVQINLLQTLMVATTFGEDDAIAEYILGKILKCKEEKDEMNSLVDAI